MNILILTGISHNHRTGLYNAVIDRAVLLKRNNINITLVSVIEYDDLLISIIKKLLKKNENYKYLHVDYFEDYEIEIKYVQVKNSILSHIIKGVFPKLFFKNIAKKVDKLIGHIDIIHSHWIYPHGLVSYYLAKIRNIRYITTGHGSDIHTHPKSSRIKYRLTRFVLNNSYFNFFVSEALEKEMKHLFSDINTKSDVTYNGVIINNKIPEKQKNNILKIGFVGNLLYVKGADRIIPIFSELNKLQRNIEFHIIGDGKMRKLIEKQSKQTNLNVNFHGKLLRTKTLEKINEFDLIIIPSREEGLGIVAIEALTLGTKTVSTNVGGLIEVLGPLNLTCEYEKINGNIKFAQFCSKIIECNITYSTLRNFANKFDLEHSISKEISIYYSLIKN